MKKKNIILIISILIVTGCTKSWDTADRQEFLSDCKMTEGTETMCLCILNCLELEYKSYAEALNNIPKSEPNTDYKECYDRCN